MKNILLVTIAATAMLMAGCTENQRARAWGGSATINLPAQRKLVNVTWKEADMWILTRSMTSNDVAETYEFVEKSSFGVLEGAVKFIETKN